MLQKYQIQSSDSKETALPENLQKEYAIEFENVSRLYRLHHEPKLTLQDWMVNILNRKSSYEDFWALKDISFKLEKGKTLGIIGQNGAGKSTLLKLATNILSPTSGTIKVNGRVSAMLELGTGFHPDLSARDNIYLNGAFYGFSRKQMDERYERIVEFSELGKFIDTPVKHFSSGMYMRLGFAIAITVEPDILIIDEVLAVGDAAFGRKCHQAIEELKQQSKAMLFVSHSAGEVARFCDEVIYIAKGQIVAQGKPGDMLDEYIQASMGPTYFTAPLVSANKAATEPEAPTVPALIEDTSEKTVPQALQISNGITQLSTLWNFKLDSEKNRRQENPAEFYLAVLNPQTAPTNFELKVYKQGKAGSESLRTLPIGHFELGPNQTLLLKLEEGAILNSSQLMLKASTALATELVSYVPGHRADAQTTVLDINPAQNWYFPFCDIRFDNLCEFEMLNLGETPARIALTIYPEQNAALNEVVSFNCSPNSKSKVDFNQLIKELIPQHPYLKDFHGGISFQSDSSILIERHYLQNTSPRFQLTGGAD